MLSARIFHPVFAFFFCKLLYLASNLNKIFLLDRHISNGTGKSTQSEKSLRHLTRSPVERNKNWSMNNPDSLDKSTGACPLCHSKEHLLLLHCPPTEHGFRDPSWFLLSVFCTTPSFSTMGHVSLFRPYCDHYLQSLSIVHFNLFAFYPVLDNDKVTEQCSPFN